MAGLCPVCMVDGATPAGPRPALPPCVFIEPSRRRDLRRSPLWILRVLALLSIALFLSGCLSYRAMGPKDGGTMKGYAIAAGAWLATAAIPYLGARFPSEDPETGVTPEPYWSHEKAAAVGMGVATGADLLMAAFILGLTGDSDPPSY